MSVGNLAPRRLLQRFLWEAYYGRLPALGGGEVSKPRHILFCPDFLKPVGLDQPDFSAEEPGLVEKYWDALCPEDDDDERGGEWIEGLLSLKSDKLLCLDALTGRMIRVPDGDVVSTGCRYLTSLEKAIEAQDGRRYFRELGGSEEYVLPDRLVWVEPVPELYAWIPDDRDLQVRIRIEMAHAGPLDLRGRVVFYHPIEGVAADAFTGESRDVPVMYQKQNRVSLDFSGENTAKP